MPSGNRWSSATARSTLAISQLRQALDDPGRPSYIETIPKRGYRLTVPVAAGNATDTAAAPSNERAEAATGPAPAVATAPPHARRRNGPQALVLALAATVVLLAGAWWIWRETRTAPSVAVLPFANLSSDPEQGFFADGLTLEILGSLSRIPRLRVIGRDSSFRIPDTVRDPDAAANLLGARYVLTGGVRREGSQIRVSARLIAPRDGEQLWAATFDRPFADIFHVQEEIAAAVADALQIRLGVGELAQAPGMTRDLAAYEEYVRGRAANLEWSETSFPRAIAHLRRAVAIDPGFSLAWAELNTVCGNAAQAMPDRADEWRAIAAEALSRAHALAPHEPQVLLAQAIDELRRGEWRRAADTYERLDAAYRRLGRDFEAAGPRGIFLLASGHARSAVGPLEMARAHEPLAPAFAGFLGQAHLVTGNFRAAFAEADHGRALSGLEQPMRELALRIALNSRDAREIRRRVADLPADASARIHRELLGLLDRRGEAGSLLRTFTARDQAIDRVLLAEWAAYFGEPELALDLLRDAAVAPARPGVLWEPLMSDVRRLPGFRDLLIPTGIVEHWRANGWPEFCRPLDGGDFECS